MVARPPAWRLSPWNKKLAAALIGPTSGALAAVSHCQTLPVAGNLGGGSGGGGRPASPPPEDCSDTERQSSVITTSHSSHISDHTSSPTHIKSFKSYQWCKLGIQPVLYRIVTSVGHEHHDSDGSFRLNVRSFQRGTSLQVCTHTVSLLRISAQNPCDMM